MNEPHDLHILSTGAAAAAAQLDTTQPATQLPKRYGIRLQVNGSSHQLELDPRTTMFDMFREHLHLTGTKKGCDHGRCGTCTVIVDGRRLNACPTLAPMDDGGSVTTSEGFGTPRALHPMQAAFVKHDAFQCGYCTPRADLLGRRRARRDRAGRPKPRERRANRVAAAGRRGIARAHERQHLLLRAYANIVDAVLEVGQTQRASA